MINPLQMWLENDFRDARRGITRTLAVSTKQDLLNPNMNVPSSKSAHEGVKLDRLPYPHYNVYK